jgi:hypothetical protein
MLLALAAIRAGTSARVVLLPLLLSLYKLLKGFILPSVQLTLCVQVPHYFTDARQAAQVECAILLIDQAACADFDDLQACERAV